MGSFKGHVLPGTLFLGIGLWHIWSSIARHVSNPKGFRVRVWNPVPGPVKHLELYVIAVGAFVDMCIELLYSTHLKFFVDGVLNPSHMNDFEHSAMLFMFFVFGVLALLSETTRYLPLPEGTLSLVAATAFMAECLLFYFHSTTHKGLEGYYHLLLVLLVALCIVSTVAGSLFPTSFPVDLTSGVAITLQGMWFYQTALTLYGPMMPEGCRLRDGMVMCRSTDSEVRGELLANFQLFSMVFGVFISVVFAYALLGSRYAVSSSALQNGIAYQDTERH